MKEVKAQARFQRIAPKKVRLVADLVRNLHVLNAQDQLAVSTKKAAPIILKILNSAIANARHNDKLSEDELIVTQAYVDEGPTLKRWRPRAFGRAAQIRKKTSHITIVVGGKEKPNTKKQESITKKLDSKSTKSKSEEKKEPKKDTSKKEKK